MYLDETTDLALTQLAKRRGRAKAELMREALASYLERQHTPCLLPRSVGMGRSGVPDLAERDEELLAELYKEKHARITADWEAEQKETAR